MSHLDEESLEIADVWRVYEAAAAPFAQERRRLFGEDRYLDEMLLRLGKARPRVLDLGCGTGVPIARYLIGRGCEVTGVDAAPAMIARAEARFPTMTWVARDMRGLSLGRRFDAIVAWDSFFHLPQDDQRAMFAVFRDHLEEDGMLLFTSGPEAGEAIGDLFGRRLFHASLDPDVYRALLEGHGFEVVQHRVKDPQCGDHTVWLARRR